MQHPGVCFVWQAGHPIVGIFSGTASLRPAKTSFSQHWADLVLRQMDASGVIPQLSVILGPPVSSDSTKLLLSTADFTFTVQHEQQAEAEEAKLLGPTSPGNCSKGQGHNVLAGLSQHHVISQLFGGSQALASTGMGRLVAFLHALLHQSLGLMAALVAALQRAMLPVQAACEPAPLTVPNPNLESQASALSWR